MKTFVIKNIEGENLYVAEANSFKEAVEEAVATGVYLYNSDLSGANLGRANLGGADLGGANLYGANLEGANLTGADLAGAYLAGVDLAKVALAKAILYEANLYGANLYGADLRAADLHNTNLTSADLAGANLSDVKFYNQFENISSLEQKVVNWAEDRGLTSPENSKNQFLKTIEEVGELASALAKNDKEALIDAVGDVIVTLVILAKCENLSATECLASAYKEIKDRKGKTEGGVFIKD